MNQDYLIKVITDNFKHKNYERTVELSKLYTQIVAGKGTDELLKQFNRREDDQLFEQRVILTQEICSSTSHGIIKTFNKIFRTAPIVDIDFVGDNVENKIDELKESLKKFEHQNSIDDYLKIAFLYLNFIDPNAFILTTFGEFDPKKEKPKPYPSIIYSENIIDYKYVNGKLEYLITKHEIDLGDKKGSQYNMYIDDLAFSIIQVPKGYKFEENEIKITINRVVYKIVYVQHKAIIPVVQVGYELDLYTRGESFVSPLHSSVSYYMKLVKAVSEFDLTMCLHAFPQKFQYVEGCSFDPQGKCSSSGQMQANCKKCGGSGTTAHTTAQDIVYFKKPRNSEDFIDLSTLIHYEHPPIELLQFQKDYINEIKADIKKTVFNAETFTKDQIAKTATGENIDMQNVYDTLYPFANSYSRVWKHIVEVVSNYIDYKEPILIHKFPNDFKLKSVNELLNELNLANSSGANGYIKQAISMDLLKAIYIDNPEKVKQADVKNKFYPFSGKTESEINLLLSMDMISQKDKVLYAYFEKIFEDLENESLENNIWFYDMNYATQKKLVNDKVSEYLTLLESENTEATALDLSNGGGQQVPT